jgi:hypothetical protein
MKQLEGMKELSVKRTKGAMSKEERKKDQKRKNKEVQEVLARTSPSL